MNIREQRLANDYRALQRLCAFKEPVKVKIVEKRGNPPDYYLLQLSNCKGVESVSGDSDTPKYRTEHTIEIRDFPLEYGEPGQLPTVIIKPYIFHPNVYSSGKICFEGDDKNALIQPLDFIVERVISVIQYENIRFGTETNKDARTWANRNKHLFPLRVTPNLNWR